MSDEVTEVTSKGWLQRITESIKGVLTGGALFLVAFPVLWWNEGRAVQTYKSLMEGRGAVVSVASERVDAANEGVLVHTTGQAVTEETLADPVFGASANAIKLSRKVEMYQWVESVQTKKQKKLGGKEETVKTYSYSQEWREELVASGKFKKPEGHANPATMLFESRSWRAAKVTLGAFTLSDGLKGQITGSEKLPATEEMAARLGEGKARVQADALYVGANLTSPAVGDLRVSFSLVPATEVSVIARQKDDSFAPFQTDAGDKLEMLQAGDVAAADMFQAAEEANVMMTWILRLVGFLMMMIGIGMVLRPIEVVADVVPLIGDLVGMGIGLVSFAIAAPLSLLTIAFAWIFYRPLLGIALIAVAVGIGVGLKSMAAKKKAAKAAATA